MEVEQAAVGRMPLAGLLVIEAGSLIAASYCGQLLADFGATVIKVEAPKGRALDTLRQWGRHYKHGEGFLPFILNRNKRLVTLDMSVPEGARLLAELLKRADALVENFKPGTLAGWGFGEEQLAALNDKLIHVAISGYGQTGPMRFQAAFGAIAEAMGGLRALIGFEDRPPARPGVSIGDFLAGLYAAFGLTVSLLERQKSGKGQLVDVGIYEAVMGVMEDLLPVYKFFSAVRGPVGTGFDRFAPSNIYPCRDGWVLIAAATDGPFRKLARCMGKPELIDDERFKTQRSRADHRPEIDAIVTEWTRTFNSGDLVALLRAEDVPAGKSYTAADIMADPHIEARQMVVRMQDDRIGEVPMQGVVPKMSRTPGRITHAGGAVGHDTESVYSELLGLSAEEMAGLRARGVI
jgi:succinyl-CoA--D-citramalate CoA-transferase